VLRPQVHRDRQVLFLRANSFIFGRAARGAGVKGGGVLGRWTLQ